MNCPRCAEPLELKLAVPYELAVALLESTGSASGGMTAAHQLVGARTRYYTCPRCECQVSVRETDCDPGGCPGWAHFNAGEDGEGIERCDTCCMYPSDHVASLAHARHCRCGAGAEATPVARCHRCLADISESHERFEVNNRIYCGMGCVARDAAPTS